MVGRYENHGMGGVSVSVPKLLKWEKAADAALLPMTVAQLKKVYAHYARHEGAVDATAVIRAEIDSCATQNPLVAKHLEYYGIMTETYCDTRIAHLVGGSGRFPANTAEALAKAAREERAPKTARKGP